ncbi:amidohydrolase [Sandarakinorhabdus cyanobacteriorum]|nr:amidohydrolase [Sandarakinorhabdus cyanobacteriorum]
MTSAFLTSTMAAAAAALAILAASPAGAAGQGGTSREASVLFVNGRIYTPTGWRSAMRVEGERIAGLGGPAQASAWRRTASRVIDLKGATVLPGLYDMHVHPVLQAKGGEGRCRIPQDADAKRLLALVADCVKAAKPGEWVTGAQWQASLLEGTPITAATLDAVSPNNPLMLFDVSGHSIWANSKALELAGITADTPNPEGGIIERDAAGKPTGILRETAGRLVTSKLPPQPQAETARRLQQNLAMLAGYGVVGHVDAMVYRDDLEVYASLADKALLKQRVRGCIAFSEAGRPNPAFEQTLAARGRYARRNLDPNCIKVFADGVPTESHTAAMLAPYQAGQPNAPPTGLLLFDPAQMGKLVTEWDKQGIVVMFHAAGDRSVREALNAIEAARKANGPNGPIHHVGHSTFVDEADLPRFKALNAAVEMSPYLWDPQPINDDITSAVGPPRIDRVWPIKDVFANDALVIAGSDWAVVPTPDPWIGIETAITRRNPGGSERSFGLGEAITLSQAIDMFTINAAKHLGIVKQAGSIETGKSADFLILDDNPFDVAVTSLHLIRPRETWIRGERVFARRAPQGSKE